MSQRTILGIDPGGRGALAYLSEIANVVEVIDMPMIEIEVNGKIRHTINHHALTKIIRERRADVAFIEKVHSSKQMSPRSAFTFGVGYGALVQVLDVFAVPLKYVSPVKWKPEVGIPPGSEKSVSLEFARRRWPAQAEIFKLQKHDGRAEAALIAHWGSRQKT